MTPLCDSGDMATRVPPTGVIAGMRSADIATLARDLTDELRRAVAAVMALEDRMKAAGVLDRDLKFEALAASRWAE